MLAILTLTAFAAPPACADAASERIDFAYNDGGTRLTELSAPVRWTASRPGVDQALHHVGFLVTYAWGEEMADQHKAPEPVFVSVACDPYDPTAIWDRDGDGIATLADGWRRGEGRSVFDPSRPVLGELQAPPSVSTGCECTQGAATVMTLAVGGEARLHLDGHDLTLAVTGTYDAEEPSTVRMRDGDYDVQSRWSPRPKADPEAPITHFEVDLTLSRAGAPSTTDEHLVCRCGC